MKRPFGRFPTTPGDLLNIVAKYLLNGMILQVIWPLKDEPGSHWLMVLDTSWICQRFLDRLVVNDVWKVAFVVLMVQKSSWPPKMCKNQGNSGINCRPELVFAGRNFSSGIKACWLRCVCICECDTKMTCKLYECFFPEYSPAYLPNI